MPYLESEARLTKVEIIDKLFAQCKSKGDINYCCTRLVHLWAIKQMKRVKSLTKKYDILNDAYGILCCAAGEFYNAVVFPYEKLKRQENGPVSQLDASPLGEAIPDPIYKCNTCGKFIVERRYVELSGRPSYSCPYCRSNDIKKL